MKKAIFTALACLLWIGASAQGWTMDNERSVYKDVINVDSANAIQLIKIARRWAISRYGAGKDMIELYDDVNHELLIKPMTSIYFTKRIYRRSTFFDEDVNFNIAFVMFIEAKENRVRITTNRFLIGGTPIEYYILKSDEDYQKASETHYATNKKKQEIWIKFEKIGDTTLRNKFDERVKADISSLKDYLLKAVKEKDW